MSGTEIIFIKNWNRENQSVGLPTNTKEKNLLAAKEKTRELKDTHKQLTHTKKKAHRKKKPLRQPGRKPRG